MEKLIITACICGAEVTKEHNPNVPYTVEEIAREAMRLASHKLPVKTKFVSKRDFEEMGGEINEG